MAVLDQDQTEEAFEHLEREEREPGRGVVWHELVELDLRVPRTAKAFAESFMESRLDI